MRKVDCLIVGGGPAGLAAAVNLARMRRDVLVVDDRDGRSLWGQVNRNYLGFPRGVSAARMRLAGRSQAAAYGARFLGGRVASARSDSEGFVLRLEPAPAAPPDGEGRADYARRDRDHGEALGEEPVQAPLEIEARTLILATGVRDSFPRFPGWAECVGVSLFWCINCDGYEMAGKRVAVVGHDEDAAETALDLLDFTPNVVVVAGRAEGFHLSPIRLKDLADEGIAAHPRAVREYDSRRGRIRALVLDDDAATRLTVDAVFAYRRPVPRNEIALALGAAVNELGHIVVDSEQRTSVPGLYAAGDVTSPHDHQVAAAVHEGTQAAAAANYRLYRPVQRTRGGRDEG